MNRALVAGVALWVWALPGTAAAQDGEALARRVEAVAGARVAFHFAVDPEVTVCENGFRRGDDGGTYWGRSGGDGPRCPGGPLDVVLTRDGGRILDVDMGPLGGDARDVDLGEVAPDEASAYLLSLHRRGASPSTAEKALPGAVVARGSAPAAGLLDLARDRSLDGDLRRSALFWVSQVAAEGIDTTLTGIAADAAEDQEVRDAAVFALSQRPDDEAVPALMDLARTAPHARTRKSALFWLSQADDARVPDFFAELILGPGG